MGFYGRVFYQLANSFGKFIVKNSGLTKTDFPSVVPSETTTTAIGLDSAYHFDTGNRWIKLVSNSEDAVTTIYHSAIPSVEENVPATLVETWSKTDDNPESAVQLIAGDCVAVPSLAYDDAGHIVGIKEINHFKLPISTVESDISELKTDMETVLGNDTTQNANISDLQNRCDNLEDATEFIGSKLSFTTVNSSNTITNALGSIDNLRSQYRLSDIPSDNDYDWTTTSDILNVSRAILDLDTRIKHLKAALSVVGAEEYELTTEQKTVIEAINALDVSVTTIAITYQDMLKRIIALEEKVTALGG